MAFIFEGLWGSSLTLSILYLFLSIYTFRRLKWLHTHSTKGLNTRKLYVMTLMLTAILRFMSFLAMLLLDLQRVHYQIDSAHFSDDDNTKNTNSSEEHEFFEKATLVLFDFPDFCCISAYVLLIVVWAETYLKSRRHWLSNLRFRRVWMFTYFIFNIVLYSAQVALYSLLFLPNVNQYVEMNLIYLTLAGFSLFMPMIWLMSYFYLAFMFSGFPFSTMTAKMRLRNLNHLGSIWTFSRMFWGLIALTTVLQGWLTEAKKSKLFYSVILVCIFFVSEIVPIMYSLQPHMIQSLSEEHAVMNNNSSSPSSSTTKGKETMWSSILYGSSSRPTKPSPSEGVVESEHYMDADHLTHLLPSSSNTPVNPGKSSSAPNTAATQSKRLSSLFSPTTPSSTDASPHSGYRGLFGSRSTPVNISIHNATGHSHHQQYVVNPMFQQFNQDLPKSSTNNLEDDESKFHDAQTLISPTSSIDERASFVTADSSDPRYGHAAKSPPTWWTFMFGQNP